MRATLFLVSILTLSPLTHPRDPALLILGAEADPQALDLVREQLGLNKPIAVQALTG